MPDRSSLNQLVQIAPEATPGTVATTGFKRFATLAVTPGMKMNFNEYRPQGRKVPTLELVNKEWTEAGITGPLVFQEAPYILSSLIGKTTPTSEGASLTAKRWTFSPNDFGNDDPQTFTIQQGEDLRAHQMKYGLVNQCDFTWSREAVEVNGNIIAQILEDDIEMNDVGVTDIALKPVQPGKVDVYMDNWDTDEDGTFGQSQLLRHLEGALRIPNRYNPIWVVNSAHPSFDGHVEIAFAPEISLTMEADAAGMALLADARAGNTKYIEMLAEGPIIDGTVHYSFRIRAACQVKDVGEFTDAEGLYAIEFTLGIVYDPTWGNEFVVDVVVPLAAL